MHSGKQIYFRALKVGWKENNTVTVRVRLVAESVVEFELRLCILNLIGILEAFPLEESR